MKTVAVVDDDVYIGNMLETALVKAGYAVTRAYSGTEAKLLLERGKPDLILLDLMLPGLSGEELLPELSDIPVIVVSAKTAVEGKVKLLLGGAADYVTKPFEISELLARIELRLREHAARTSVGGTYAYGELELDPQSHTVKACGEDIKLTKTEYAILKLLIQKSGRVTAKGALLDEIAADTPDCTESSLKTHVSNLRKKLRAATGKDYIESIWGIGFKLG